MVERNLAKVEVASSSLVSRSLKKMHKKSIALISNNYWTLYRFRYDVIKHLQQKGYNIYLIAEKDGYEKKFQENITCYSVNFSGRSIAVIDEITSLIHLNKLISQINPSLIINFTIKPNIYSGLLCRIKKIKYISMITGLGYFFNNSNYLIKKIIQLALKITLKASHEVWFTNKSDKEFYQEKSIIKNQITSIVPGAGIDESVGENFQYKKEDPVTFVMISRLLNEKGTLEFIESAKYFYKYNKYKFILIGNHENNKHYVKKYLVDNAVRDNVLIHHMFTDDIDKYYGLASCIVLPSYREGLSTILLEAAVRKIPIITTNVPGCQDVVKDENYGFLCKPKSSQSLVDAMSLFIRASEDELKLKTENTYNLTINDYSRKRIIEKYDQILDEL